MPALAGTRTSSPIQEPPPSRRWVIDWHAETRAFLANTIATDQSWARPNRRFVSRGLYLPGDIKENVGTLVWAVDVSCSVSQSMLDEFAGELTGLMRDARPER
jgi:predicted metal-dependent peptidase